MSERTKIVSEEFSEMPIIDFEVFLAWQASQQDNTPVAAQA